MPRNRSRFPLIITASLLLFAAAAAAAFYVFRTAPAPEPLPAYEHVRTLAGLDREFSEPFGIAVKDGIVYVSDGAAGKIFTISPEGVTAVFAEGLHTPSGIAFAPDGRLIVADAGSHAIRSIASDGSVATIAGIENRPGFADGNVSAAQFYGPIGVAVAGGQIFVSDTYNDRIRVIENNSVRTLAGGPRGYQDGPGLSAKFDTPLGIAAWHDKVLVADSQNRRIRVVEPDGTVWTLTGRDERPADGPLSEAAFSSPSALAVNKYGTIFVADGNAVRVIGRRIFPYVETLSNNSRGYADGSFPAARFNRPSGIAVDANEDLIIADSDNQTVRIYSDQKGSALTAEQKNALRYSAEEFRDLQPARWPYDPPDAARDVAGTLGEIRGAIDGRNNNVWFHNGLDIAGAYGETARFVRSEKVLDPHAAQNFATGRELLRMPTMGYIHIRLGRDQADTPFADPRFLFSRDAAGKLSDIRVPRGTVFDAGDPIGTLNSQNHVHLIAGRPGSEMNAIDALRLPGVADTISPVIESVSLYTADWQEIETSSPASRTKLLGNTRIVVTAFDRMDGNPDRRRLGLFRLGYQVLRDNVPAGEIDWTIRFDRMPASEAVDLAYAAGSRSGATGQTAFRYIVSNLVNGDSHGEGFFDAAALGPGQFTLRVFAADFFGNITTRDMLFEVSK